MQLKFHFNRRKQVFREIERRYQKLKIEKTRRLIIQRQQKQEIEQTRREKKIRIRQQKHETEQTKLKKKRQEIFVCRSCSVKFLSNIKFHLHITEHHIKKSKHVSETSVEVFILFFALIILSLAFV